MSVTLSLHTVGREALRTAEGKAVRAAAGKPLDAAFAQTVCWLFAPANPDRTRTPAETRHARSTRWLNASQVQQQRHRRLRSSISLSLCL